MDVKFIEKLFFEQIKQVTKKNLQKSYDYQFSDEWVNNFRAGGETIW
jgi:hypothetical protein